jgi:hypothetical protein
LAISIRVAYAGRLIDRLAGPLFLGLSGAHPMKRLLGVVLTLALGLCAIGCQSEAEKGINKHKERPEPPVEKQDGAVKPDKDAKK